MLEPILYTFDLWCSNSIDWSENQNTLENLQNTEAIQRKSYDATFFIGNRLLVAKCRLKVKGFDSFPHENIPSDRLACVKTTMLFNISAGYAHDLVCKEGTVRTAVRRLREGEESMMIHWRDSMNAHVDQARESIAREEVLSEHWFSFELGGRTYLFAMMIEGVSQTQSFRRFSGDLLVDELHKQFKQAWDRSFTSPHIVVLKRC